MFHLFNRSQTSVDITQIPRVMRVNDWIIAADLLEQWFNNPANDNVPPDTTTIKMDDWVLQFQRVKRVYEQMLSQKIWLNHKAQAVIVKMLQQHGKLTNTETEFGDFTKPVPQINDDYIQYRTVGSIWDPTDDLFASLGRLTLRMAIKGSVKPTSTGHKIFIKELGIYTRDSFDFNGPQHLGYWNIDNNYGGKNFFRGIKVKNADFREWSKQNNRGGDYLVFSDLKTIKLEGEGDVFETTV
jgi:hypothetical protein